MSKHLPSSCSTRESENIKETFHKEDPLNCRICFKSMDINQIPQICDCKTTESAIHQTCLSRWIKATVIYEEPFQPHFAKCHVCKAKIPLTTKTQYNFFSWKRVDFCHRQLLTTLVIAVIFLIGALMIASSVFLLQSFPNDEFVSILAYSSLVVGSLITLVDAASFVYVLMIEKTVSATGVKEITLKETQQNLDQDVKNLQSPNDSYAKLCIQITTQQGIQDITE